jgi:hypothetical protein
LSELSSKRLLSATRSSHELALEVMASAQPQKRNPSHRPLVDGQCIWKPSRACGAAVSPIQTKVQGPLQQCRTAKAAQRLVLLLLELRRESYRTATAVLGGHPISAAHTVAIRQPGTGASACRQATGTLLRKMPCAEDHTADSQGMWSTRPATPRDLARQHHPHASIYHLIHHLSGLIQGAHPAANIASCRLPWVLPM